MNQDAKVVAVLSPEVFQMLLAVLQLPPYALIANFQKPPKR
jgi:hypothetical protein